MLNINFCGVFIIEDLSSIPTLDIKSPRQPLCTIEFSVEMVRTKIRGLKPTKAPRPDGIDTYLLHELVVHCAPTAQ